MRVGAGSHPLVATLVWTGDRFDCATVTVLFRIVDAFLIVNPTFASLSEKKWCESKIVAFLFKSE